MLRRLSAFFATLALATGLSVATTTPAQAAGSCTGLSTKGTASTGYQFNPATNSYEYRLVVGDLVGTASSTCSASSYKYDLVFERSNGTSWTSSSGSRTLDYRADSTYVSFPSLWLKVPSGKGTLKLTVRTWVWSPVIGTWFTTHDYDVVSYISVPGSFNTATDTGSSSGSSCYAGPDTSVPLGYTGWC